MDENNRSFLLAIVLSICVLIFWQFFYAGPKMEQEQARLKNTTEQSETATKTPSTAPAKPGAAPTAAGESSVPLAPEMGAPPRPGSAPNVANARVSAVKATARIKIDTPSLIGSISLRGARIDDLTLRDYRVAVAPGSANVVLLSPSGSPNPYYAEHGWVGDQGTGVKLPQNDTVWQAEASGPLTPTSPIKLKYDNGEGIIFRRTISIDENYLFSIRQQVENKTDKAINLYPYALISRHGKPSTQSFYILHEGLIGVMGEKDGLQEIDYDDALEEKVQSFKTKKGWLGITDKYWSTVLIPDQTQPYDAKFSGTEQNSKLFFQTDYLLGAITIPARGKSEVTGHLFAGAKQVHLIDAVGEKFKIENFELLIDWGWFYFLTKPLFFALDYFGKLLGNFGLSILLVTVLIKLVMFPLANKSYVSMSKMKKLQPEMTRIRERYPDDKARQQQALMEIYKKEKVNPMSGCLPIVIQIPVFFALYKVLFVTIEMRHAPFFGWIQDLSAPDPSTFFNLFGLIPWDPPSFLLVGIWPVLMGITMWVQMKLNPQQPDPMQQKIFAWMPVMFTFLLAQFPAGLVIYWAWNNLLSIIQQWVIMSRQGVKVDLFGNLGLRKIWARSSGKTGAWPLSKINWPKW
ncbi:membrane protein insertase YidC [bacterium MnTg02]|nr:membrane protein insertase YidC [bacterium MnTg02]